MRKFIPILLVLVLLTSGCLQPRVENQERMSEYIHPDLGFTMKYPQSWNLTEEPRTYYEPNYSRIVFTSPDNQARFMVDIKRTYHPEGKWIGGVGLSNERPNSTFIASDKNIQVANFIGYQWIFLVKDPGREFYDIFLSITQICPGLENNRIDYFFKYEYTAGDPRLEETIKSILDSIEFTCPSGN